MTFLAILVLVILFIVIAAIVIGFGLSGKSVGGQTNQEIDAKRFARLLATEIKLYNDYKVERGIQNNSLSESLADEIAEARKKYNSRCSQPQFEKYFDEALVDVLANGDRSKMGNLEKGV